MVRVVGPDRPGWTTERTLRRSGTAGHFHLLGLGPGEPPAVRADLVTGGAGDTEVGADSAPVFLRLLHLTDFQIADLSSPARVDYLQAYRGDEQWAAMLPGYRPQEFTGLTQVEAMARTVRALLGPPRPVDLVVTTGDNVDSQQRNELADFLALMAGGRPVHPLGARDQHAVVSARAAAGEDVPDWARVPDTPTHPGALAEWAEPFATTGFGVPWLACYGNHDALVQGRAPETPALARLLDGAAKPIGPLPRDVAGDKPAIDSYVHEPACFSATDTVPVAADLARRTFQRAEFVAAQREAGGVFGGDLAYTAHQPHPAVKVLALDTTNPGGYADGSIGATQLRWLADQLVAAHSRYRREDGTWVATGNDDQLVVLCSHHGLSTLTNDHVQSGADGAPLPGQDLPRALAPDVEALLGRFPNVVLWLSGHIHQNRVRPVRTPAGGFWEVATGALIDWPCQARCVDLTVQPGGPVRIRCRQIDHLAAADPADEDDRVLRMASIGRRIAANVFDGVGGPRAEGTPLDRNVDLLVPVSAGFARRLRRT